MSNYLYVIRLKEKSELVKVGITRRPVARMKQLEVGTKADLLLLIETENNRTHEKRIHKRLRNQKIPQTEWFNLNDAEQQHLLSEVSALGAPVPLPAKEERRRTHSKPRRYDGPKATPLPPDWVRPKPAPKPKPTRSEQEKEAARKQREKDKRARERAAAKAEKERLRKAEEEKELLRRCKALLTARELDDWEYFEEFWGGCEGDERLSYLEAENPWIEDIYRPDWRECWITEEGVVAGMAVTIYFTEPDTKETGFIALTPPAQPGGSDEIEMCSGWLFKRHGRAPEDWEEAEEWLWMLTELPKDLWPAEVHSRAARLDRERRKYEELLALEPPLGSTVLKALLAGHISC